MSKNFKGSGDRNYDRSKQRFHQLPDGQLINLCDLSTDQLKRAAEVAAIKEPYLTELSMRGVAGVEAIEG